MTDHTYADLPLNQFLEQLASDEPAPGGGAAAAAAAAMAAALVEMAARFSGDRLGEAQPLITTAAGLRARATQFADDDGAAYQAVLAAYKLPKEPDPQARRERIREALAHAADVPLALAQAAAEAAALAADLAERGNPNLRGDALTAARLADAAVRSAATLVALNVEAGKLDPDRSERASTLVRETAAAVTRAERAGGNPT